MNGWEYYCGDGNWWGAAGWAGLGDQERKGEGGDGNTSQFYGSFGVRVYREREGH